jgi:YcaO-like protein with predicted kinase domain
MLDRNLHATSKIDLLGTIRARTAGETLSVLRPLLSGFGITRVARVTGLDEIGIPTSICIRPNARHLATAQGKGLTPELADISAIMESIEGYHAEIVPAPFDFASFRDTRKRGQTLDPRILDSGPRWSTWSEDFPMRWVEGQELLSGESISIPFVALTMDSSHPHPEFAVLRVSTNGLASGNNRVEALLHAMYELMERDAEFTWSCLGPDRRAATLVDSDTIDTPFLRDLLARFRAARQLPIIWDITNHLQVPAFRCVLVDQDPVRNLGRFHGSGAHLSKAVALSRALTEAAQARLTWICGTREDVFPSLYADLSTHNHGPLQLPRARADFRNRQDPFSSIDLREDLDWVISMLRSAGYSSIAVYHHTSESFPVSVVSVLIPGMRFSSNQI